MTSMIFGAVCSPCIAEHVKNKNAERFRIQFPEAASIVINKHYVDDLVTSFHTPEHAIKICKQIVAINSEAGFELRNFISNCGYIEKAMNKTPATTREVINMERNQTADKVLGMYWNTRDDTFEFHTKFHRVPQPVLEGIRAPTKRELLGIVMPVFDPFGLLANFLITTKIIIQDTWRLGIGWDEKLDAELAARWSRWWKEFPNIKEFQVPRYYSPSISHSSRIELHIFADASQEAFAAVGYFRVVYDSSVDVSGVGYPQTSTLQMPLRGRKTHLGKDCHWIKGPDFLKNDEEHWPSTTIERSSGLVEEVETSRILYCQLKRTVAWVIRAQMLFRRKSVPVDVHLSRTLTAAEIDQAERIVSKQVQQECFASEIAQLSSSRKLPRQSVVYSLTPYLDEDGLLRLNGRIDEATCLPFDVRRPILLPSNHVVAALIVQHYHEQNHHQNTAVTINAVRQRFWIPHIKTLLKKIQRNCLQCKINKASPVAPMVGQLPPDRLTPYVRPFSYTGVDLFGPFNVTVGRRREKRWGVIFTCLTVRAAHIELAEHLSTDAFILCLWNFINRRGTPVRIRSDNGTNFIGAQKDLKNAEQLFDTDRIQAEAANKIVKSLLSHTLREVAPRVDTLQSVLIEAENIINSRPLTDLPLSHEDDEPLTPNHFLIGCVNSTQTPNPVDEKICLRKQWRIAQNLKDRLWKRWTTEYLPQLICRSKWREKAFPLQLNDLVLICEPSLPRSHWQKGRVTKVFPTNDGQVRVADVKTSSGLLRRPATRLARLIVEEITTCERCDGNRQLHGEIQELKEIVKNQNKAIMEVLAVHNVLLKDFLHQEAIADKLTEKFPLKSVEDIDTINAELSGPNKSIYKAAAKSNNNNNNSNPPQ
ncbi:uncharacterized protein LOC118749754 [Rhagoletis pomonella]|uniref:uncharacterized protein LOC118749754 n=1 Tax=Rhagoletis pomonella TaxID=28610 RepID=UPI001780DF63|nr:uncharacterized protein LOC118749754 [Rhagoletis pomonella]